MQKQQTRDFLIRNIPIDLYHSLESAAKAHHRSVDEEAIAVLSNGLKGPLPPLKKPKIFQWGKKITNCFIQKAIDEGRESSS